MRYACARKRFWRRHDSRWRRGRHQRDPRSGWIALIILHSFNCRITDGVGDYVLLDTIRSPQEHSGTFDDSVAWPVRL